MMQIFKLAVCPTCGRTFQKIERTGRFCSQKCRGAFNRARAKQRRERKAKGGAK